MNILLINTFLYPRGGDTTYTFAISHLLQEQGHAVSFFGMQDERNLSLPNRDLFVSAVDFRALVQNKNFVNGLKVLTRSIYSVEARRKFSKLLDRVKPGIVHLQNIHAHITPSIILEAKKRGIPVVWTLHDYKLICPNSHFLIDQTGQICESCHGGHFWQAAKLKCKKNSLMASGMASIEAYCHQFMGVRNLVNAFLCPSAFLLSKLLENGFEHEKSHHLPLFLPQNYFNQSTQHEDYFLFLGKLEKLKGIEILLEAARLAPQVKVVIAGRADEVFLRHLSELLPPNVSYVGFKTGEDLVNLRRSARAVVLPSLWYENQPFCILESFAIGKPVIASDLGGMRELIGDNERGILVPHGDAKALAMAMINMAENQKTTAHLGTNAFEYATKNHTPEKHYRQLLSIYQQFC